VAGAAGRRSHQPRNRGIAIAFWVSQLSGTQDEGHAIRKEALPELSLHARLTGLYIESHHVQALRAEAKGLLGCPFHWLTVNVGQEATQVPTGFVQGLGGAYAFGRFASLNGMDRFRRLNGNCVQGKGSPDARNDNNVMAAQGYEMGIALLSTVSLLMLGQIQATGSDRQQRLFYLCGSYLYPIHLSFPGCVGLPP